jgi:hypothetical protein
MPKTLKTPKHPREMTTGEAANHLFHPAIVQALKNEKDAPRKQPLKKE